MPHDPGAALDPEPATTPDASAANLTGIGAAVNDTTPMAYPRNRW